MVDLVYSTHRKLLADDVTMYRDLRLSVLMRWLQEISIAHTEALGAGRAKPSIRGRCGLCAEFVWKLKNCLVTMTKSLYRAGQATQCACFFRDTTR